MGKLTNASSGWLVAASLSLLLTGCGDDDSGAGSDSGIKETMAAWSRASTPAEQCDLLSSGFRFFIGDDDPGRDACIANVEKVLGGPPAPGELKINKITEDHDQVLVDATLGDGESSTYYLVEQYGGWRINSINIREGIGPPPPPASEMD